MIGNPDEPWYIDWLMSLGYEYILWIAFFFAYS